ncbi:P-loop NTPase family protein [Paenibacillus cymbidii]|uniref:hypothetical protein n=1 Tax=Paenibacillus cymbidii TaxID=1639034 RepID=UPI00108005F9|nr:hypothetical protein [Paenibacillus cymbidii]
MHRTVDSWERFRSEWDGVINFLMKGETVPFHYRMPPIERIVEELRHHPDSRITPGTKGNKLDLTDISESFRKMPIEEAVDSAFALAHFKLPAFYGSGKLLDGFEEQVLQPWQRALREAGFTWERCYPILFISGPGRTTNYHLDYSHVLAWQVHGTKTFVGLKDPDRWAPLAVRLHCKGTERPADIGPEDELAYVMTPGTVLWNTFLTPHWVEASDRAACSVNISHGGLRYKGRLCLHEQEVVDWQLANPDKQRILF